jgi:hypothetical protein
MGRRILNNPALDAKLQKALEGKENEVEIDIICSAVLSHGNVDAHRVVLQYGRPFTGVPRPKGYRQWARRQCFRNSHSIAERGQAHYCEGFVISPRVGIGMLHAWVTLDGANAVDVTLLDGTECGYFGISFGHPMMKQLIIDIMLETGCWPSLLSPPIDPRVIDALKTLRADGLI